MTRFGKSISWTIILLLLFVVMAGGGIMWFWMRSDDLLKQQVTQKLDELVPDWNAQIGRARYDWKNKIHLHDLVIQGKEPGRPLLQLPEVILTIDLARFQESQELVLQKVQLKNPVLNLLRRPEGTWNWQSLSPPPQSDMSLPEVVIHDARMNVLMQNSSGAESGEFSISDANFKLVPSSRRHFSISGLTQINQVGKLQIKGALGIDSGTWNLSGKIEDVKTRGELLSLMASQSAELRTKLQELDRKLNQLVLQEPAGINRSVSHEVADGNASSPIDHSIPNFGLDVSFDLGFQISREKPGTEPKFNLQIDLRDGKVTNPVLPFPLNQLAGTVLWDNDQIEFYQLSARNGETQIQGTGKIIRTPQKAGMVCDVKLRQIPVTERLRDRLTPGLKKLYRDFSPTGTFDLDAHLNFSPGQKLKYSNLVVQVHQATGQHTKFPYPVQNINGFFKQRGDQPILDVNLTMKASGQPGVITGWVQNPGPAAESNFWININHLPIDDVLLNALENMPSGQKTLLALGAQGQIDAKVEMYRPPGLNQKFEQKLDLDVHDAAIQYEKFPYPIDQLSGHLSYHNREKIWRFENLQGAHDKAKLKGHGTFDGRLKPGTLDLHILAENAPFDNQLKESLPPDMQRLWESIAPRGSLSLETDLLWIPGQPLKIMMPWVRVEQGEMLMSWFQYRMKNINAEFNYNSAPQPGQPRANIVSFRGEHDRTAVSITKGELDWDDNKDWRVRLDPIHVDDLIPDSLFRTALPTDLRRVVNELNPTGAPISLSGMLEFRGASDPRFPVTAAWQIESVLTGSDVWTGIEIKNIRGSVSSHGLYDGKQIQIAGSIDLESADVWGTYQLNNVKGPYFLHEQQIWVGMEPLTQTPMHPLLKIPNVKPVSAQAIGGQLYFTGDTLLTNPPQYQVRLNMTNGRLEEFAQLYLPGTTNLSGKVDCWMHLRGVGESEEAITGNGQLLISDAALYKLPVFVQMFNAMGGIQQNNPAFKSAFAEFDVEKRQYIFNEIALVGDSIDLRGKGTARFDGKLNLDFYSKMPQTIPLPILGQLVGEASRGLVGVQIRGNVNVPQASVKPVPVLTDAIQSLMGTMNPQLTPFQLPPPSPNRLSPVPGQRTNRSGQRPTQLRN